MIHQSEGRQAARPDSATINHREDRRSYWTIGQETKYGDNKMSAGRQTISLEPSETILEADLKADIPHAHACGGRAKCSTCRIIILKGLENCSPRTELEQVIASRLGFSAEVRLACQTKSQGDVAFRRLVLNETDLDIASQLLKKRTGPVGESKPIAVLFSDIRHCRRARVPAHHQAGLWRKAEWTKSQ